MVKHYNKTNWIYCVSLILDPRQKLEAFDATSWGKDLKDSSHKKFLEILKKEYCISNTTESSIESQQSTTNDVEENEFAVDFQLIYLKQNQQDVTSWEAEVDKYFNSPRCHVNTNILKLWKDNEVSYPCLSKMARDILSIMATSVPVERLFSSAALIMTDNRASLSDESLKALICIHSWMKSTLKDKICKVNF